MPMYEQAASIIREAEVFIITAGAGMGVDSGLPDFRGEHGFWNAYPAYARLGLSFAQCADPMHFFSNPHFAPGGSMGTAPTCIERPSHMQASISS